VGSVHARAAPHLRLACAAHRAAPANACVVRDVLSVAVRLANVGGWIFRPDPGVLEFIGIAVSWLPSATVPIEGALRLVERRARQDLRTALLRCAAKGEPFDLVVKARTEGCTRWLRIAGEAQSPHGDGQFPVHGVVQDVTNQQRAAREQAAANRSLAQTLEEMTDGFVTFDRRWRFIYVNAEAERVLRRRRGDLVGKVLWDEFPEAVGTVIQHQYERALREGTRTEFETYYAPLATWFQVRAHPTHGGLAVYLNDVTQQHRAREALADSEAQYRILFDNNLDAVLRTRPDGTILRANAAACTMFAMSEAQICVAGKMSLVVHDERFSRMLADRDRAWMGRATLTLVRGDGSRFEADVWSAAYRAADGELRAYTVCRDLTEALRSQRQIEALTNELRNRVEQRTAELQQANADLRAFANAIAHDLRSSIGRVAGFAAILDATLEGDLPGRSRHYLHRIRASAQCMDDYTQGLLALAKVAQVELQPTQVNLTAVARDILAHLQEVDPHRRVDAHIEEGMVAVGDHALLRIALENLLSNAWKFTAKRELARISFTSCADGGETAFCIRDNGAGFPASQADSLFNDFRRLHKECDFPGHGMGLVSVRRIIARHGGRVSARGIEGEGAAFHFTLP
jgi:PAS domain S-box-containing protein